MNLFVFSSNRALNDFYINNNETILPDAKNIKTFFEDIIIQEGKTKLPKSLRSIILWSVIQNIETQKIGFDKAFLRFVENSSFLFKFFDELESAMINIDNIDINDTYGDYEDHLKIISKIYKAYLDKLENMNIYDIGASFKLHTSYLKYYKNIYIFIDGVISRKDFHILKLASNFTNIEIIFEYSKYNSFIFEKTINKHLEVGYKYTYNINKEEIINKTPLQKVDSKITLYSFSMRINQSMLVIAKVNEWLKNGIENIAIILPDEDFAKYLKVFDAKRNLNYAMGIEDSNLIAKLQALKTTLDEDDKNYKLKTVFEKISQIDKNLSDTFLELKSFNGLFENLSYSEILEFILINIKNIDDVSGGKVKVMGVLETRGVKFDKIIIVDFNEEFVPKLSDNDMFLNTNIRKKVGLPTLNDKENLQRHYYHTLIGNSKEVCIAFCQNKLHSTLLDDLNIDLENTINGDNLWRFFPLEKEKNYIEEKMDGSIIDYRLSPSSLKVFIECKLKFYFSQLEKIRNKEIEDEEDNTYFGRVIHECLKDLGNDFSSDKFKALLDRQNGSPVTKFNLEIKRYQLEAFLSSQRKLLSSDREILHREFDISVNIFGFEFRGKIDRIDKIDNEIFIIDYKAKNNFLPKNEGFLQLLIYKKAVEKIYNTYSTKASYYDLYKDKEYFMKKEDEEETQKLLESTLEELKKDKIEFIKTENLKICKYCDYKYLCNRY